MCIIELLWHETDFKSNVQWFKYLLTSEVNLKNQCWQHEVTLKMDLTCTYAVGLYLFKIQLLLSQCQGKYHRLGFLIPARQATQEIMSFTSLSSITEDREFHIPSAKWRQYFLLYKNQTSDLTVRVEMHFCKDVGEKSRYDERFKSNTFPSQ